MEDNNAPATKGDIAASEARLEARLKAVLEGRMDAQERRLLDEVSRIVQESETRLLKAFYSYAEGNDKRLNHLEGSIPVFFNRLGTVETRLLEVEKRLNMPPQAN